MTTEEQLKIATQTLDRIACDWEHMKRKDMVEIAAKALCEIGLWRKVEPGEFARNGRVWKTREALKH